MNAFNFASLYTCHRFERQVYRVKRIVNKAVVFSLLQEKLLDVNVHGVFLLREGALKIAQYYLVAVRTTVP